MHIITPDVGQLVQAVRRRPIAVLYTGVVQRNGVGDTCVVSQLDSGQSERTETYLIYSFGPGNCTVSCDHLVGTIQGWKSLWYRYHY